jgi:hypothetical protein
MLRNRQDRYGQKLEAGKQKAQREVFCRKSYKSEGEGTKM